MRSERAAFLLERYSRDVKTTESQATAVLSLIAEGCSYSQIVDGHQDITYLDIFHAAEEALRLNETESSYHERLARIKEKYPRAYEKWSAEEDRELKLMHERGASNQELADHFRRQPSAIGSRIQKLEFASTDKN